MGIYIKGMEMPKDRPLIIKIAQDGTVYMSQGIYGIGHGVATAVPVPPHGRLIDADALIEAMARMVPWAITDPTENAFLDGLSAAYEATNAAPTIIPAEQAEEGE